MKRKFLLYGIYGLVLYLLFLIIVMPASWFAWSLNRYSEGMVRLDPVTGTIWGGYGQLAIFHPQTTPHDFGQTRWRVNPAWLLTGRLQLTLDNQDPNKRIHVSMQLMRNGFTFRSADVSLSAALVAQVHAPLSLISPRGRVSFQTNEFQIAPDKVQGTATLEWRDAGSSLSSVQPLGDYRIDIVGAGKSATLKITTLRGDLDLTGEGSWQPSTGQIQLRGTAIPRARVTELESLLNLMGVDQGAGRRSFDITTRHPAFSSDS